MDHVLSEQRPQDISLNDKITHTKNYDFNIYINSNLLSHNA